MYVAKIKTFASSMPATFEEEPILSTNKNVVQNSSNSGLEIKVPGVYKVRCQATLTTSSAVTVGFAIHADGETIALSEVAMTTPDDGGSVTLATEYPVVVEHTDENTLAQIEIYPTAAATLDSGYVLVERIS